MADAIYVHIPFCRTICTYCDFPKRDILSCDINEYLKAIEVEFKHYFDENKKATIKTIYIGGGTPTALNETQLEQLLNIISKYINTEDVIEYSIEVNPETITIDKVKLLKKYHINRVSIGVQTFNDKLLKLINRNHNQQIVLDCIKLFRDNGFNNINIDMIYAIPSQTINDLINDIETLYKINPDHISYYSLILEEKSILFNQIQKEKINLPDEDAEMTMMSIVNEKLKDYGYEHYEISNFAKDGKYSYHNLTYWNNENYYGIGMGAHGYLNNTRYQNSNLVSEYCQNVFEKGTGIVEENSLTNQDKLIETIMLGFRKVSGIDIEKINQLYNIDFMSKFKDEITKCIDRGLLVKNNNWLMPTNKGLTYNNELILSFIN